MRSVADVLAASRVRRKPKKKKGLAAMSPAKRRAIARKGNQALRAQGKVHKWTPEEAREAQQRGRNPGLKILEQLGDPNVILEPSVLQKRKGAPEFAQADPLESKGE